MLGFSSMLTFLKGKRTYILATLGLITIGANWLGFIDLSSANLLLGMFGFGGLITLRSAVQGS